MAVLHLRPGADDRVRIAEQRTHLQLPGRRRRLRTVSDGSLYREYRHDDAPVSGDFQERPLRRRLAGTVVGVHAPRTGAGAPEDRPVRPGENPGAQEAGDTRLRYIMHTGLATTIDNKVAGLWARDLLLSALTV